MTNFFKALIIFLMLLVLPAASAFAADGSEPPEATKLEASWRNTSLCPECKIKAKGVGGEGVMGILIEDLKGKEIKPVLPMLDSKCGAPGKPIVISLKTANARLYKEQKWISKSGRMEWVCDYSIKAASCDNPLVTAAQIADVLYKDKLDTDLCLKTLRTYNDQCGPYKSKSVSERFTEVQKISKDVLSRLKASQKSASTLSPWLLVCTANRETSDFDPMEFNVTACRTRLKNLKRLNGFRTGKAGADKQVMGDWVSTAYGLVNMVYSTFKGEWKKIEKQKMLYPSKEHPDETYGDRYKHPSAMFMEMMVRPELQIEMMARYLLTVKSNPEVRSLKDGHEQLIKMVGYYDNQDRENYVDPVMKCAACLSSSISNK